MIIPCYGRYSPDTNDCEKCRYIDFCKEATDFSYYRRDEKGFTLCHLPNDISSEATEGQNTTCNLMGAVFELLVLFKSSAPEIGRLFAFLDYMMDLKKTAPEYVYSMIIDKIRDPSVSYRVLAQRYSKGKTTINHWLDKVARENKLMAEIIVIDKRRIKWMDKEEKTKG